MLMLAGTIFVMHESDESNLIYLDHNASTPVDPRVFEAMRPYLTDRHGNPSSGHAMGRSMAQAIETARAQVAAMLGAGAEEIVFTSGGTESNNLAIKGVAERLRDKGRHIITSAVEHPAAMNPCLFLEARGYDLTVVGVDETGLVDPQDIERAIRRGTILITIMHANNEVGTIQPIADIARIARRAGVLFHSDAAQTCGKISTRVAELGADLLTMAGHKMCAPQGIGALYIRAGVELEPLHHGAGHESGRRAGTEPVAAMVALGAAAALGTTPSDCNPWASDGSSVLALRDRLHAGLTAELGDDIRLNGHPGLRLPNTLSVGFRGRDSHELLAQMPRICASPGAACHARHATRSSLLATLKVPESFARGTIRFSLGRTTTQGEIDEAIPMIVKAVRCFSTVKPG